MTTSPKIIIPQKPTLLLASGSPRRWELLSMLRLRVKKVLPDFDESTVRAGSAEELVRLLSEGKGRAALALPDIDDEPVISADTVVELNGTILGKPHDKAAAFAMLSSLSGKTHRVHTGISVSYHGQVASAVETAEVDFRALSDNEIIRYISTGEPFDKAGGYGIQGSAGIFISAIRGDYYTIVGLPLCRLHRLLIENLGIDLAPYYLSSEDRPS